jgi:glycosyltransferase involved in cell wall biosynthesis
LIVLLEPRRPAGFQSGGYRYQAEVMAPRLLAGDGCLLAVAPDQLEVELARARRRWPAASFVVDGLFAAERPLPAGTIALLHMVPTNAAWRSLPGPVLATAAGTLAPAVVRALSTTAEVVEPGLDACFLPLPTGRRRRPGPLRVVAIGGFGPGKGQADLWRALGAAGVPSELVLLGAGTTSFAPTEVSPSGATLVRRGVVPPSEVATTLHDCDLCVSWSRSESFGMAVAEAVACGTPVLAFAVGAIPNLVEDGENGWLLPPTADDAAMAALLHGLLCEPSRLERARALARHPGLLPWPAVAARFAAACGRLGAKPADGQCQ